MYENYYGFTGKPFQLNPDPSFYFGSRQHRRAMAYLEYGLHQNEGFIVVTGEIGAGKTTLVRNLHNQLDPLKVVAAHLVSTQLDADDILRMVAAAFGIPTKGSEKSDVLLLLEAFLVSVARDGKRCLLILDEAQNLTPRAVEELRMLSNFQLETHALLQSFLIGQPEFRETLQRPEMEQLRQRVIAACHIGPLDESETRQYVEHRLKRVGWTDTPTFDASAFRAIFESSGGIPRRINSISDRLLWYGYLGEQKAFSATDVEKVDEEMNGESRVSGEGQRNFRPENTALVGSIDEVVSNRDVERMPTNFRFAATTSRIEADHRGNAFSEELFQLAQGMKRLESTLLRIERNNVTSAAKFQHLLDSIRRDESD